MKDREESRRIRPESETDEDLLRQLLERAGRRPQIPDGDFRIIKAAARAEWNQQVDSRRRKRSWAPRLVTAAATAGLAVAIAVAWWAATRSSAPIPLAVASVELIRGDVWLEEPHGLEAPDRSTLAIGGTLMSGVELVTGAQPRSGVNGLAIRLIGHQSVRLGSGTRLRLISRDRLELLVGAVYVDSGEHASTADGIEIVTSLGSVFDIGTQFEVGLEESQGELHVRVRSGAISLVAEPGLVSAGVGEEIRLAADGSITRSEVDPSGEAWDWILDTAPAIDIEGLNLTAFLDWVSGETGWRVEYEDELLAGAATGIELHGTIDGLRPDEAVMVVLPGSGLGHEIRDSILHIERLPPGSNGL